MYRKIRITVASLAAIMLCVAGSSMTLSYFTDTDAETNNFKIGNVATELTIYGDANGEHELADVIDDLLAESDGYVVDGSQVPFYLSAKNTGNITVYQRFRVVIPEALKNAVALELQDCTLSNNSCSNSNYLVTYDDEDDVVYYIVNKNTLGVSATTTVSPTTKLSFGNLSGVDTSEFNCESENNCTFGVKAYSDAIQTTGFADAEEAFRSLDAGSS